jgi:hypothetical protein
MPVGELTAVSPYIPSQLLAFISFYTLFNLLS